MSGTGGVSRSGRVRKKSAKLIEMETEVVADGQQTLADDNTTTTLKTGRSALKSTPIITQNNVTACVDTNDTVVESVAEDTVVNSESDSLKSPPNKKLKLKLCLNPSPSVAASEPKSDANDGADSTPPKRATIPPLKIPRSKITSLVPNSSPPAVVDTNDTDATPVATTPSTTTTTTTTASVERKTKKLRKKSAKSDSISSKTSGSEEVITDGPTEDVVSVESSSLSSTHNKSMAESDGPVDAIASVRPIEETPKAPKAAKSTKKGTEEKESAANRLFRQITSGVTPISKTKANSRRNKSLPLEVVTQISFDDEFAETALIIDADEGVTTSPTKASKPKPKRSRSTSKSSPDGKGRGGGAGGSDRKPAKRGKSNATGDEKPKKKRNAVITAYMLWSKEHRSKIQHQCPDLDFADISRRLGEVWQAMADKEKIAWRRKAQKLVTKGSSIISTGKPKASPPKTNAKAANHSTGDPALALNSDDCYTPIEDLWRPIGTAPIDVSSHLKLLGESLTTIGERLKEHSGQIAVSGSLSVLLDSTLCAIGPLLCLTQLDHNLNGCSQEIHKKTLDNIAYIMPGI